VNGQSLLGATHQEAVNILRLVPASSSVADSDPGSGAFWSPGSGMIRNPDPGSGINVPDHISKELSNNLRVNKYLNSFSLILIRDSVPF
jgi:hypothetical protein